MNEIDEKYEALARYIKAYDFKNLPTLMFPKEDTEYLYMACKKQIPSKPIIEPWSPARCPSCNAELSEFIGDGYYKHWYGKKVCDCGQQLKWDED